MSFHHHKHTADHDHVPGRVDGPGLLYGGVGVVLAVTLQLVGLFKRGDAWLKGVLAGPLFGGEVSVDLSMSAMVCILVVLCFGLAFAMLDSAGTWRRVVLGVTLLVLVLAMVPAFGVWGVYFSPFPPVVGVFWSWFCTLMYVNHHRMSCDVVNSKQEIRNSEPVFSEELEGRKVKEPDEKYQPKDVKEAKVDG